MNSISKNKIKSSRHMGLEYLRSIAALMVVVNHAWYMEPNASHAHIFTTAIIYTLVLTAVPLFVLMSGAFLIPNTRNTSALQFWKHSFRKLFPLSLFFFVLAFFWETDIWNNYRGIELISKTLEWYANGATAPLWYLCMLPGLYLALPLLAKLWQHITIKNFTIIGTSLLALNIYVSLYDFRLPHPISAVYWLGHFILGAILLTFARQNKLPSQKKLLAVACVTVIACISFLFIRFSQNTNIYDQMGINTCFPTLILTFLLFCIFSQWNPAPQKLIIWLSELSFLIYLTHVPCQRIIRALLYHTGYIEQLHSTILNNVLFSLSSLALSITAAYIIHKVYLFLTAATGRLVCTLKH